MVVVVVVKRVREREDGSLRGGEAVGEGAVWGWGRERQRQRQTDRRADLITAASMAIWATGNAGKADGGWAAVSLGGSSSIASHHIDSSHYILLLAYPTALHHEPVSRSMGGVRSVMLSVANIPSALPSTCITTLSRPPGPHRPLRSDAVCQSCRLQLPLFASL